jgi:hypothetical protein
VTPASADEIDAKQRVEAGSSNGGKHDERRPKGSRAMVALVSQQVTQRHTTKHDGKNRQDGDGTEGKERTSGH